ncbi:MAG: hypothetical protein GY835_19845 [bacterium]|nr:hypothetical protein [bacterium]
MSDENAGANTTGSNRSPASGSQPALENLGPVINDLLLSKSFIDSFAAAVRDRNAAQGALSSGNSAGATAGGYRLPPPIGVLRSDSSNRARQNDSQDAFTGASQLFGTAPGRRLSHSSEDESDSSDASSNDSDEKPKRKKKKHSKVAAGPLVWKAPKFTEAQDVSWKGAESSRFCSWLRRVLTRSLLQSSVATCCVLANKLRYIALVDILKQVHAFRLSFLETDAGPNVISSYNDILGAIQLEMEYILVAEESDFGWATSREVQRERKGGNKSIKKAAARAEKKLKLKRKEGKAKQPFPSRSGGSAGLHQSQQISGAPVTNNGQQFHAPGVRFNQQSATRACFICGNFNHLQRQCPNNPQKSSK